MATPLFHLRENFKLFQNGIFFAENNVRRVTNEKIEDEHKGKQNINKRNDID